jgi:hypothetical protein
VLIALLLGMLATLWPTIEPDGLVRSRVMEGIGNAIFLVLLCCGGNPWPLFVLRMQVHPNEEYMIVAYVQGVVQQFPTVRLPSIDKMTFVSVRLLLCFTACSSVFVTREKLPDSLEC